MKKSQLILKDKTIYSGQIKNNKPHGKGAIQYTEEKITWIKRGTFNRGDFVKGEISGRGCIVEGNFKKGKPIGNAKITYKIGRRDRPTSIYYGQIKKKGKINYVPHGNGVKTDWDGNKSKGEFKNGLLKKGKMFFAEPKFTYKPYKKNLEGKWINWPEKK